MSNNNTNTNLGSNSLTYNKGINNTAIGASTLTYNTIAGNNTALGAYSLAKNTTGMYNVAIGTNSQLTNVTGSNNVAVGPATLFNNTADVNTAIGANSLQNNTTGFSNTALGANSLQTNTTGCSNTALGFRSGINLGLYDLSGNNNTFLGALTDVSNNGICNSTAIGFGSIIDASNQIMIGTTAETVNIPGILLLSGDPTDENQAATKSYVDSSGGGGTNYWTLDSSNNIYNNTGVNVGINNQNPAYSLDVSGNINSTKDAIINSLTIGIGGGNIFSNTAIGYNALLHNTDGSYNTANGYNALYTNTTGYSNTANGINSLYLNIGGYANTANGFEVLYKNIDGYANTGYGANSLYSNTTGLYNTANGVSSLYSNTSGQFNTAIGYESLFYNTTGSSNTANGVSSLNNTTNGSSNTAIGGNAGYNNISGSNNTFLGANTDVSHNSIPYYNNSTAVGYGAIIDASNQIVLGTSLETVKIPGIVNITGACTAASFSTPSDYRIKDNVKLLDSSFNVDNLRPVTYLNKLSSKQDIGLIAHELQENYPYLVTGIKDGLEKQTVNYIGLIPVLIKEIQDLKNNNQTLNKKIDLIEELLASIILKK